MDEENNGEQRLVVLSFFDKLVLVDEMLGSLCGRRFRSATDD